MGNASRIRAIEDLTDLLHRAAVIGRFTAAHDPGDEVWHCDTFEMLTWAAEHVRGTKAEELLDKHSACTSVLDISKGERAGTAV